MQKNYWKPSNFEEDSCDTEGVLCVETNSNDDLIKQERNISPKESVTEPNLYIIKYEETEPVVEQVIDLQISKEESSDYNDNNFDQSISVYKNLRW